MFICCLSIQIKYVLVYNLIILTYPYHRLVLVFILNKHSYPSLAVSMLSHRRGLLLLASAHIASGGNGGFMTTARLDLPAFVMKQNCGLQDGKNLIDR